jgi:hypothetical protein
MKTPVIYGIRMPQVFFLNILKEKLEKCKRGHVFFDKI